MRKIILLLLAISMPVLAGADDCLTDFLIIDRDVVVHYSEPTWQRITLPSFNVNGRFLTHAGFQWISNPTGEITPVVDYQLPAGQTGLPFHIYRIAMDFRGLSDTNPWTWDQDLTQGCQGPGRSVFSGQSLRLPVVKPPARPDGAPRNGETVHLRIWGHL